MVMVAFSFCMLVCIAHFRVQKLRGDLAFFSSLANLALANLPKNLLTLFFLTILHSSSAGAAASCEAQYQRTHDFYLAPNPVEALHKVTGFFPKSIRRKIINGDPRVLAQMCREVHRQDLKQSILISESSEEPSDSDFKLLRNTCLVVKDTEKRDLLIVKNTRTVLEKAKKTDWPIFFIGGKHTLDFYLSYPNAGPLDYAEQTPISELSPLSIKIFQAACSGADLIFKEMGWPLPNQTPCSTDYELTVLSQHNNEKTFHDRIQLFYWGILKALGNQENFKSFRPLSMHSIRPALLIGDFHHVRNRQILDMLPTVDCLKSSGAKRILFNVEGVFKKVGLTLNEHLVFAKKVGFPRIQLLPENLSTTLLSWISNKFRVPPDEVETVLFETNYVVLVQRLQEYEKAGIEVKIVPLEDPEFDQGI